MTNFGAALLLVALLPAAAILRGTNNNMDLTAALGHMHPEQVGTLLHTVELKWEEARASSLRNLTDENTGLEDMVKSCSKVAKAIIAGSDGDKDKVVEYMNDVCAASENEQCKPFASGIEGSMSDDAGVNRNDLDLTRFCQGFWSGPVTVAAKVLAQKASEEDALKAKEEAKIEEEKTNEALAATKEKETQAASEAVNKTAEAVQRASEVQEQVKSLEDSMAADDGEATKALDRARQEEQVANEKEAKADEAKVAPSDAAADADEAKALEEGDAKADAIAAKATEKAEASEAAPPAEESSAAAAQDDAEAIAAGDAVAQKIADKALKKEASLVAAKVNKNGTKIQLTKYATKNMAKNVTKKAKNDTKFPWWANATKDVANFTQIKTEKAPAKNGTKKF